MRFSTQFQRKSLEGKANCKCPRMVFLLLPLLAICLYLLHHHLTWNLTWTSFTNAPKHRRLSKVEQPISLILNSSSISMDDPRLLDIIRKEFIIPPSSLPYNFGDPELNKKDVNKNPSLGAVQSIQHILETFTDDPFYVECGANNAEWGSNSIWLEKMGWQGLLIEADTPTFADLLVKHRKAYQGHFCLSDKKYPKIVNFYRDVRPGALGSSLIKNNETFATSPISVQCFPLVSVLLAMERPILDFLSLDIEGSELDILQTVDFNVITIKVITIENVYLRQGKKALRDFMESQGYVHFKDVSQDSIFVHPTVWKKV